MVWQPSENPPEVSLSPESIEMLARRLSELLQPVERKGAARLVSAKTIQLGLVPDVAALTDMRLLVPSGPAAVSTIRLSPRDS